MYKYIRISRKQNSAEVTVYLTPMLLRRGDRTGSVSMFMESTGDW